MDRRIKSRILEIMSLAIDVNARDKNTCFVNFQGHIESIYISVHENGWSQQNENIDYFRNNIWLSPNMYMDGYDEMLDHLNEVIAYLTKLKNADAGNIDKIIKNQ